MKKLNGCCFIRQVYGPACLRVGRHNRNKQKQSSESQGWPKQHFETLCSEKAKTKILGSMLAEEKSLGKSGGISISCCTSTHLKESVIYRNVFAYKMNSARNTWLSCKFPPYWK